MPSRPWLGVFLLHLAAMSASAACLAGQAVRSRHVRLSAARFGRAAASSRHPAQAAGGAAEAGGEGAAEAGGAAGGRRRRCERVTFLTSGEYCPWVAIHVTQFHLDNILQQMGAVGFAVGDGAVSLSVEDLPEGGTVQLVLPDEPPLATQVCA